MMMEQYNNKYGMQYPVGALSIMTSCGCNLKCEYCKIAQASNANSPVLQKATVQALKDGTFLANVQAALHKLEQSCSQIESIDFWGQEPTLTLDVMAEHVHEWLEAFPNWRNGAFSTNTVGHMDRLVQYFKALDNALTHEFHLSVQLSYDGDYSTDNLRGASSSVIHDNIIYMYNELNKINFRYLKLRFNNHGVLSFDLLKKLQDTQSIFDYTLHLIKWGDEFVKLNNNKNVQVQHGVDINLEAPAIASVEDGLRLMKFCELSERILPSAYLKELPGFKPHDLPPLPHESIYLSYGNPIHAIHDNLHSRFGIDTIEEAIVTMQHDAIFKNELMQMLNPILFCGNGVAELKFMYDGTLCNCQNHIYDTDVNFLKDNGDIESAVKHSLATHKYFINPLVDSDEDLCKYFHLFYTCKYSCLEFMWKNVLTLMQYLIATRQVDVSYAGDLMKVLKHGLLLALFNCCSYNNQVTSGSIFLRHLGFMRVMCNGFLDKVLGHFDEIVMNENAMHPVGGQE